MKKQIVLGLIGWLITSFGGYKAAAQESHKNMTTTTTTTTDNNGKTKQTQEVIIRKNGDKDSKFTIEINADTITVNGKPLVEFKEDGVTINNRKMIINDDENMTFNIDGKMLDLNEKLSDLQKLKAFQFNFNENWNKDAGKPYTYLGVATDKSDDGAIIINVTKESPAEKAGLQKADIIYKINDKKINNVTALSSVIREMKDGDKVKVYYLREGKKNDVKVTLGTRTENVRSFSYSSPDGRKKSLTINIPKPPLPPQSPDYNIQGFSSGDFSGFTHKQKLGLKIQDTEDGTGVKVLEVENTSAAATAGILKDDVLTEIGGVKVTNTDEAREQLQQNKDKTSYDVKAKRNGTEMPFTIKTPKKLKTVTL